jgi:hypothetical protein
MSNLFTYMLEGNLNLSVTMTTISVIVAFGKELDSSSNATLLNFELIARRDHSLLDLHIGTAFDGPKQHQDAVFGHVGYSHWTFGASIDRCSLKEI